MNKQTDFFKRDDGIVVNTNKQDFLRSKKRNITRRKQEEMFVKMDEIIKIKDDITEIKHILHTLLKKDVRNNK